MENTFHGFTRRKGAKDNIAIGKRRRDGRNGGRKGRRDIGSNEELLKQWKKLKMEKASGEDRKRYRKRGMELPGEIRKVFGRLMNSM